MGHESELDLFARWAPVGGRYTSYPARRAWKGQGTLPLLQGTGTLDAYLHVPFCESLCNFCGLNITVTKDRAVVTDFIRALLAQAERELEAITSPRLGNLFLGGGTPNYLSANELARLLEGLLRLAPAGEHFHGAMEALPSLFTPEHAQALKDMGFSRLSLGVQDLNPLVLALAHREQTSTQVGRAFELAHEMGMEAHADMIYGLAGQTPESFRASVRELLRMRPQGVALYPLISPPWALGPVPLSPQEKALAYLGARDELLDQGFQNLGQGHFVAPGSSLHSAFRAGTLRRNLSAFFERLAPISLGLGPGAQGYSPEYLWANQKIVGTYQTLVMKRVSPVESWHALTAEEKLKRRSFEKLLTTHRIDDLSPVSPNALQKLQEDGLVVPENKGLKLTPRGPDHLSAVASLLDGLSL